MRCVHLILASWTLTLAMPLDAATVVDLNDFFADSTVTVSMGGTMALLAEDPLISPVLLSNDPGLGEPVVIFATTGGLPNMLSFEFMFLEPDLPSQNDDEFGAFVIDAATGLSVGPAYEFFTSSAGSGAVSWNLGPLDGLTLGLQFQLNALPGDVDLDSTVKVSNVQLNPTPPPIPEPASLAIWGMLAWFGHVGLRRRAANR